MFRRFFRPSYLTLLAALTVLVFGLPWLPGGVIGRALYEVTIAMVLIAGLNVSTPHSAQRAGVAMIIVPALVLRLIGQTDASVWFAIVGHSLTIGFVIATCAILLRRVAVARRPTGDLLSGSVAVFLLMAFAWALLYEITFRLDPSGSFSGAISDDRQEDLLYLSVLTLTSVGYGDIVPGSNVTRLLAALEAIAGQLYLAIVVARIVGLELAFRRLRGPAK